MKILKKLTHPVAHHFKNLPASEAFVTEEPNREIVENHIITRFFRNLPASERVEVLVTERKIEETTVLLPENCYEQTLLFIAKNKDKFFDDKQIADLPDRCVRDIAAIEKFKQT